MNYKIFKSTLTFEDYIVSLPIKLRVPFTRFRCRNHKLPIERQAYLGVVRDDRKCRVCNSGDIGDEFHYLLVCTHFNETRKKYIKKYYWDKPSTEKMFQLLNIKGKSLLSLSKFVKLLLLDTNV